MDKIKLTIEYKESELKALAIPADSITDRHLTNKIYATCVWVGDDVI